MSVSPSTEAGMEFWPQGLKFTMNAVREQLKTDGIASDCVPSIACALLTPIPLAALPTTWVCVKPSAVPSSKLQLAIAQVSVDP